MSKLAAYRFMFRFSLYTRVRTTRGILLGVATATSRTDMERDKPIDVLLIEDDPADIYVIKRVVADFGQQLRLWIMPDGAEALLFMRKVEPFTHAPTPTLILLDLKLPHLDGAQLLPQIRQLPEYQATPIVVFSSLPKSREGARCFQLGATAYVEKSLDFYSFCNAVTMLLQNWVPRQV